MMSHDKKCSKMRLYDPSKTTVNSGSTQRIQFDKKQQMALGGLSSQRILSTFFILQFLSTQRFVLRFNFHYSIKSRQSTYSGGWGVIKLEKGTKEQIRKMGV